MKNFLLLSFLATFLASSSSAFATTVELKKATNFSKEEKIRLEVMMTSIEKIINSSQFKARVLAHQFNNVETFAANDGLSNAQILTKLLDGKETRSRVADQKWSFVLSRKYQWKWWSSVTAFTSGNTDVITIYHSYIRDASNYELVRTLCHEYTHKLGFGHPDKIEAVWDFTVPYAVGAICQEVYLGLGFAYWPKETQYGHASFQVFEDRQLIPVFFF